MTTLISSQLVQAIRSEFRLDWRGIHGAVHWARVRANGLTIAAANGANKRVIEDFAFLHDVCRQNDGRDHVHGQRAVFFARSIRKDVIRLSDEEFMLLETSIEGHTGGLKHENITVVTCWDADRLDLTRIGIMPDPSRLCTAVGRQFAHSREHKQHRVPTPENNFLPKNTRT